MHGNNIETEKGTNKFHYIAKKMGRQGPNNRADHYHCYDGDTNGSSIEE